MTEHATQCERHSQVLVYDGECRLCVMAKERLERAGARAVGSKVRFIPYQCDEAKQALGKKYRPGRPDMAYLVEPTGIVREGLEAFLPLVPDIPGGWMLLGLLRLPFGATIAKWVYRVVARHRYRLFGAVRGSQRHVEW